MRALFTIAVFFSAFLLFMVEPMAAKLILPDYGGSASVWTSSILFFQIALLGGYAYAMVLGRLSTWVAAVIHATVCIAGLAMLGFRAEVLFRSGTGALGVVWTLAQTVGLAFFAMSGTSSLLQKFYARKEDPYFLYAASNVGSLLALLAYPLILEPLLPLKRQLAYWFGSVVIATCLTVMCLAAISDRRATATAPDAEPRVPPPTNRQRLFWVALAAGPSSLMLGVTSYLTASVAPIPLLWVIPLALYLLTFVIAFARRPRFTAVGVGRWTAAAATPLSLALILESSRPIVLLAAFHLSVVFVVTLACHLRLSERRPDPTHLTEYYLWVASGGAAGGLFNALIAPKLFTTLFEYPLALSVCCALALVPKMKRIWEARDLAWPLGVALVALAVIGFAARIPPSTTHTLLAIGLPALVCFLSSARPVRFGASLLVLFAVASLTDVSAGGKVQFSGRSFYGVHRVVDDTKAHLRRLVHGTTVHGIESLDPKRRDEPLTYYSRTGPAGDVFRTFHGPTMLRSVGLVGLGVGSLAAYGEPGQAMTFFEIDPVVIRIATDPRLFTFLADSRAKVRVVAGDGRLSLMRQPDHSFDLIVLDAFSSDAIPIHLLTEDALAMYEKKLTPHGFLLYHVSNNYVDLAPVLSAEARDLHLIVRLNDDTEVGDEERSTGKEPSRWLLMARSTTDLGRMGRRGFWEDVPPAKRGWTDDFSDLLSAFRLSQ